MLWNTTDSVIEFVIQLIRVIVYALATGIYQLIIWLYNIFMRLCNSRILDAEILKIIAERIGIILGIVMLFMIIFSAIQMVLEPDKLTDKEKGIGNIVKKVILVVVMLGVSNAAFGALYGVQKLIVKSDIISKFILPYDVDVENFGGVLSSELFTTFYRFNEEDIGSDITQMTSDEVTCYNNYYDLKTNISEDRNFWLGYHCLNKKTTVESDWGWIFGKEVYMMRLGVLDAVLLIAVGLGAVYFLFSYCLSVGTRTVQLAFLEIISPMAIVSYLSPKKDTMFQKWWKIYFSTYIDVFLRIAIVSLAVFLIATIFESESSWAFWKSVGSDDKFFIGTFMIMAILMFAKKAPDLIKELFPGGASKLGLGISSPKKLFDSMLGGNLVRGTIGAGLGAVTGGIGNAIRGYIGAEGSVKDRLKAALSGAGGGVISGIFAGAKAKSLGQSFGAANKAAADKNRKIAEWRANGGTSAWSRWWTGVQQSVGLQTEAQLLDIEKAKLEDANAAYKSYDGYIDAAEKRAEAQIRKGEFRSNEHANKALKLEKLAEIYTQQSATIKRSDFEDADKFRAKVCQKFGIERSNYADTTSYDAAIQEAIKNNNYTYDVFIDEEYQFALNDLANKADEASAQALKEMKSAKKDFITAVLTDPSTDAVAYQSLQQAAGVLDANESNGYFKVDDVIQKGSDLLNGDYDKADKINSSAKSKQAENNTKLAKDKVEGRAARADAKYGGGGKS